MNRTYSLSHVHLHSAELLGNVFVGVLRTGLSAAWLWASVGLRPPVGGGLGGAADHVASGLPVSRPPPACRSERSPTDLHCGLPWSPAGPPLDVSLNPPRLPWRGQVICRSGRGGHLNVVQCNPTVITSTPGLWRRSPAPPAGHTHTQTHTHTH